MSASQMEEKPRITELCCSMPTNRVKGKEHTQALVLYEIMFDHYFKKYNCRQAYFLVKYRVFTKQIITAKVYFDVEQAHEEYLRERLVNQLHSGAFEALDLSSKEVPKRISPDQLSVDI